MKLIRSLFFLLIFFIPAFRTSAETVPEETARRIAFHVCQEFAIPVRSISGLSDPTIIGCEGQILYYVFNVETNGGFVIIAGDNRVEPVLGFAFIGSYRSDNQPPSFISLMRVFEQQIRYVIRHKIPATGEISEKWEQFSQDGFIQQKITKGVSPLIQTTWDQGCYYNGDCPDDANAVNTCLHTPNLQWQWKNTFTPTQWIEMVTGELDNGRPLIYYGNDNGTNGHFFICDGYEGSDFFHMNWGWGGLYDGYFYLAALNPGTNIFTDNQGAIFDLFPNQITPLPQYVTLDFESIPDFSLTFDPWQVVDIGGNNTYYIQNVSFPHNGAPMAYICFNPGLTSPPLLNMNPHSGSRLGASFSNIPPNSQNNKWLISPHMSFGNNPSLSLWVQTYHPDFPEEFNIGVSTSGSSPADFTLVNPVPEEAPPTWAKMTYNLDAFANHDVYVGIQCVSYDAFIFMVDDIVISGNVGLAEENDQQIQVYPNPAKEFITIGFSGNVPANTEIRLINPLGKLLRIIPSVPREKTIKIQTGDLPPGLYYLLIQYEKETFVRKITLLE